MDSEIIFSSPLVFHAPHEDNEIEWLGHKKRKIISQEGTLFNYRIKKQHDKIYLCFQIISSEFVGVGERRIITLSVLKNKKIELYLGHYNSLILNAFGKGKHFSKLSVINLNQVHQIGISFSKDKINLYVDSAQIISIESLDLIFMFQNMNILLGGNTHLKAEERYKHTLFKGSILNFIIGNYLPEFKIKKIPIQIKYDNFFRNFTTPEEIYLFDSKQFKNMESTIPLRPRKNKNYNKAMICHDLPAKFVEDCIIYGDKQRNFGYRFLWWDNIDYFIYFTHYFLTIPPPSWINVAHKFGVKIYATLIAEFEPGISIITKILGNEFERANEKLKLEDHAYIRKLVEICNLFKFDGYFLNMESAISIPYVNKMLDWIQELRRQLKATNSSLDVIWYDSITHSGSLRWQSQLNAENCKFFEISDMFFTDYHWNPSYLKNSLYFSKNRSLDVFTGIDVYGRGTYLGGKFNTVDAAREIFKNPLSVALFGQAYYYENENGYLNPNIFLSNETKFWLGSQNIKVIDDDIHLFSKPIFSGQWSEDKDDEMGKCLVSSFNWCTKTEEIDISKILPPNSTLTRIEYYVYVKGTPPKYDDLYRIEIAFLNNSGNIIYQDPATLYTSTNKWELIKIIKDMNLFQGVSKIKVGYSGKDVEYWQGNYGARFAKEQLIFSISSSSSSSSNSNSQTSSLGTLLKIRRISGNLPLSTNFNLGCGKYFIDGIKVAEKYSNFEEFDIFSLNTFNIKFMKAFPEPFTKKTSLNHYSSITLNLNNAFNGSTCLSIQNTKNNEGIMGFKLFKTYIEIKENNTLAFRLIIQNFNVKAKDKENEKEKEKMWIIFKYDNNTFSSHEAKFAMEFNGWNILRCEILFKENRLIKSIYLCIESWTEYQINVGHLSLCNVKHEYKCLPSHPFQPINPKLETFFNSNISKNCCDFQISWNPSDYSNLIKYYRIFANDKWISNSFSNYFVCHDFELTADTFIKVQGLSLIDECESIFDIEGIQILPKTLENIIFNSI